MNPSCHVDNLFMHVRFINIISDGEYIANVVINCVTKLLYFKSVLELWCFISFLLYCVDIIFEVFICIRLKVREKYDIIVVFESVTERESVQISGLRLFIFVNIEWDVVFIELIVRLQSNQMRDKTYSAFSVLGLESVFRVRNVEGTPLPLVCVFFFILCR